MGSSESVRTELREMYGSSEARWFNTQGMKRERDGEKLKGRDNERRRSKKGWLKSGDAEYVRTELKELNGSFNASWSNTQGMKRGDER